MSSKRKSNSTNPAKKGTIMNDSAPVESIEFSDQDRVDLQALHTPEPTHHTLLEVWSDVLQHADKELEEKIQAGWASRIAANFPNLKFADMKDVRDRYFGKVIVLRQILKDEIASDDDCLKHLTIDSDREENSEHYRNLILQWQAQCLQWEIDWDYSDPAAAIELAAISLAHSMFFGQTGLTAHLDAIGFLFDEADQQLLTDTLDELKAS